MVQSMRQEWATLLLPRFMLQQRFANLWFHTSTDKKEGVVTSRHPNVMVNEAVAMFD